MNKCLNCGNPVKNKYCNTSCQNKHQNSGRSDKKYGEYKKFKVKCFKCGKNFDVVEREKLFPKKEKYYCSRGCANSKIWDEEDKKKKSDAIKKTLDRLDKRAKYVTSICKNCDKEFVHFKRRNRIFCSRNCVTLYYNENTNRCVRGGLKSCEIQSYIRRSKNEILFANLCKNHFKKVKTNESIFNGWDADVIIYDIKVAVLWNGKWHYEKITENHSVKQVQNRDEIKINEIKNCGYIPYIIKDMGKYNKEFVENEFKKFKEKFGGLEK